jgi:hypothetical protein
MAASSNTTNAAAARRRVKSAATVPTVQDATAQGGNTNPKMAPTIKSATLQSLPNTPTVPTIGPRPGGGPAPTPQAPAEPVAAIQRGKSADSASIWNNPYPMTYAAVPVAAPPVNPDLTPIDVANQIAEYSDWDKYLNGIGLQAANMSADTTLKVGDIARALAQNLDSTDWNMAARGLQASSIKDTQKTNQNAQAAAQEGNAISGLTNFENYSAGEANNFNTNVRPGIDAKYGEIGRQNAAAAAAAAAAATPPAPPAGGGGGAPAQAVAAPAMMQTGAGLKDPFAPKAGSANTASGSSTGSSSTGHVYVQTSGSRAGMRYIYKNGARRYESRPGAADWGAGGVVEIAGP